MDTPYLPHAIFGEDFKSVYEPAEDTFLLLDALERDLDLLRDEALVCLECGSGSGTVITALSKSLEGPRLMIGTDINIDACKTTKKCAAFHDQHNIQIIRTNLAESLVDRLEGKVDLLVFNPPYVVTEIDEVEAGSNNQLYLSWAGGENGRQLIDTFLSSYVHRLLSKPNGVAYMVALDKNNVNELQNYLKPEHNIEGSIVLQRKAGIELLYVIKYKWMSSSP